MATDIEKKIYDPKRGISVREQNMQALKKTGKAVKKAVGKKAVGAKSLAKGAARFAAPVVGAADAAQRMAQDPTSAENILTSGVKSQAKFIDEPISAISNLITGRDFTPVRTSLDAISAGAEGLGTAGQEYFGADKSLEEAMASGTRVREQSLRRRQGEALQEQPLLESAAGVVPSGEIDDQQDPGAPQPDITGLGTPIPYTAGATVREGQTEEGYTRRVEGPGGSFGEMTTQAERTGETPEQVQEALAGVEARSDVRVQNILAQQEQARQAQGPSAADQIKQLEEQLAQPGRGLRQSFGELMTEQQGRRSARAQLKNLYAQQKEATQQAGQTERAGLVSQDKARDRSLRYQELLGKRGDTARKERRTLMNEDRAIYTQQAKDRELSPQDSAFFIAKNLEAGLPGSSWDTPEGKLVRGDVKKTFFSEVKSERGLWDWSKSFLGIGEAQAPTQDDMQNLSFKGFTTDKGEMITPDWLTENNVIKTPDGNYVYLDNLSPKVAWFIRQRIIHDNPENFKNIKQTVRKGQ